MQEIKNKKNLTQLLQDGATIVTPNNRLSNAILQDYFAAFPQKTMIKPQCLPYKTLLIQSYKHLLYSNPSQHYSMLLSPLQSLSIWKELIQSEEEITYTKGLLDAIIEAWEYCELWKLSPDHPAFQYTQQTQYFQKLWTQFRQRLKQLDAISEHQLVSTLIQENYLGFTKTIIWTCFDEYTPQQLTLQNYLQEHGSILHHYDLTPNQVEPQVLSAEDEKEEYSQLISWLKSKTQDTTRRVAVVIPDLQNNSQAIQRKLLQQFDKSQFNISLGQSLSQFHLVAHALTWIKLSPEQLSNHQATLLLQSPYLGAAKEEFVQRSQYLQDSELLKKQNIHTRNFMKLVVQYAPKLALLMDALSNYPDSTSINQWVDLFQERLNALGFPGDTGLTSEQYQCFNRFSTALDELRQLHLVKKRFTKSEAIDALQTVMENTIFQVQTTNTPIQILGLLEASGCEFDGIWVMGLTDQCLPQATRLSAFIPTYLQKQLSMPHSLAHRELQFAQQTLQRLRNGSQEIVFSYATFQQDSPCLPCALIKEYPSYPTQNDCKSLENTSKLIQVEECYEIPVQQNESISGGTSILANQAKCPFKAFAEHRLKAKEIPQTTLGIDDKEKGQLIHKVLELLWKSLRSSANLQRLNSEELNQEIHQAIDKSLESLPYQPGLVKEVEFKRLKRIVISYLEWEKQRAPFSVAALEENHQIQLAGLDFKVRVDRIDQVGQSKWVIDYKSSLPSSKPWLEDRPLEPQLLLYALLDEQINTLLLLQLKTGKIKLSGFSEEKQDSKDIFSLKVEEHWEDYRQKWHKQLTELATEIQTGYCPPEPNSLTICQQCSFPSLCRIQTTRNSNQI
ncbi:PD-(D/E)XK nuclease family protein [Legionella waltersii]|uniref:Recombinase B n=1 Tax=Legionella waltersii TaxID=66969 RepID=A0A0W1A065_9GAMM|nr:PD-(D/E)XK nuclease family protein [Legionella waltersii]KTD74694.1 recombinase B [Legionella waltersii]SNV09263.1 recombinase B [Legionella waltersii]